MTTRHPTPLVPISWGELIDKITILEIKCERLKDAPALARAGNELGLLRQAAAPALDDPEIAALMAQLKVVNQALWKIEDDIRAKEAVRQFDAEFTQLARGVYISNDQRGALKRKINAALQSELVEEKNYQPY